MKFGEFVSFELVPAQDQPDDMLRQQCEGSQVEDLVAVLIDKLEDLLNQRLGAFILDVTFGGGQQGADSVNVDATLDEAHAGAPQFIQSVIVGSVHDSCTQDGTVGRC